jgi:cytochrome c oxidase subunit 2
MFADVAWFPEQASTTAEHVDHFFYFMAIVTGSVGLLVAGLLIYFSVRYRRRPGQVAPPPYSPSSRALEWFWTITPIFVFLAMFTWSALIYHDAFRAPDDATPIYVVGKQWMWKMQHPEGQREINELHVPAGRAFKLLLTSEDVIHSFFCPEFRIHMDALPERYTSVWFRATKPGTYHLFCSQYCGTNHSGMVGHIVVMTPRDYEDWLELHAEGSLALEGRKTFLKYRCVSCHSGDGAARAPTLEELYGRPVPLTDGRTVLADEDYLRESILNPSAKIVAGFQDIMPTFRGQVSEEEIIQLIAFVRMLRRGDTPPRVESFPPPTTTPPINPQQPRP